MLLALSTSTALRSTRASAWTSAPPQSSSTTACRHSIVNTITFFSHAPMSFSYGVKNTAACADRCAELVQCQAWLYSTSGQECHLYRDQPVFHSSNPLFVSGFCVVEKEGAEAEEARETKKSVFPHTSIYPSSSPTPSSVRLSSVHTLHQYTNFESDATTTPLAAQASHVHRRHAHHNH
ncbi:hypothetical protein BO83DRAFT_384859 [Aspergillus eucalypticola CBS 122712]|uniref:Apple domain-containing protein n=1 Tax=Aspergillus eucalypticola (strain CBS 122712 / IBT 29274) TaxID=1448314 RepID=A0A317WGQ7_ASPEC|nr:uncharacterized protein BO83DRAFT_384859 [Aspergillus eucalypticola CBS 122712]PWY84442.1 hypothetical protein BO83DRAFT_384859 [Aspergillus eucalypticola CBS 122712]